MNLESTVERATPGHRRWLAWTRREPALAGRPHADVRAELRAGSRGRTDEILGALVRITQEDPTVFGVLAACLLPGLRRRIGRYVGCLDRQEAFAIAAVALFEAVHDYDTETQPRFVAGRLLAPVERRLRRAATRQRDARLELHHPMDLHDLGPTSEMTAGSVLQEAVDAGVITCVEAELIADTRLVGTPLRQAGDRLGLGYEAAKKRRQRTEARWATWWVPDLAPSAPHDDSRGAA